VTTQRAIAAELRAAGCTPEEIELFLRVRRVSRRRERARRAERLLPALGAALARFLLWPAEVLLAGR
jgi:hypothetical protein